MKNKIWSKLPIKDGINLAGSICSIVAVLSIALIKLTKIQWIIIILAVLFGGFTFGFVISILKGIYDNYIQCIISNPYGKGFVWMLTILLALFIAIFSGVVFGYLVNLFIYLVEILYRDLPTIFDV